MSETPDTTHQPDNRPSNEPQGSLPLAAGSGSPTTDYVAHKMRRMEIALRKLMARCEATEGQAFYDRVKPEWEEANEALSSPNTDSAKSGR